MIKALLKKAADFIFPPARCLGCDEPRQLDAGAPLCAVCHQELERLRVSDKACGHCLSPVRSGQPCAYCAHGGMAELDQAFAPFIYRDLVRRLILRLKFGPVEAASAPLGMEMALCVSGIRFDALVPVPLHRSRLRERGMNQSAVLAGVIHEQTGIAVMEALAKTRRIAQQSGLPAARRADNVAGAFKIAGDVAGLDVLLVDDVRTTGATARECARVLREAGARSVCLLCAAVAYMGGDDGQ